VFLYRSVVLCKSYYILNYHWELNEIKTKFFRGIGVHFWYLESVQWLEFYGVDIIFFRPNVSAIKILFTLGAITWSCSHYLNQLQHRLHWSIYQTSLSCFFVTLKLPKPSHLLLCSWYYWKAMDEKESLRWFIPTLHEWLNIEQFCYWKFNKQN